MNFLLLDTNIYLNMMVWRHNSVPQQTLGYLTQVMDREDVVLVVPAVVEVEFEKNVEGVLRNCGTKLSKAVESLRNAPFPNTDRGQEFRRFVDSTVRELRNWKQEAGNPELREQFLQEFRELVNRPNVTRVPLDEEILQGVARRQISQRCPFHNRRENYADASIVETLVGLGRYVSLSRGDRVFFCTRNPKDFSGSEDTNLHSDLNDELNDLRKESGVEYEYSVHFFATLKSSFAVDVSQKIVAEEAEQYEARGRQLHSAEVDYLLEHDPEFRRQWIETHMRHRLELELRREQFPEDELFG